MTTSSIPDRELRDVGMGRPHLIILGSGASRAACPLGDRDGRRLPVMNDLVETLGLASLLDRAGIDHKDRDFETVYQSLTDRREPEELKLSIDHAIRDYFTAIRLPDAPTLYDHLVLSLRSKDVIATFNWDPLVVEACQRNRHVASQPHVLFLHGNVAVGVCHSCRVKGPSRGRCRKCGQALEASRLLYPVQRKNYEEDPHIRGEWETVRRVLKGAYILSIFGYGAPQSDVSAIEAMKEGWGQPDEREFEETEIIDIRRPDELADSWQPFIYSHHYQVHTSFYESSIGLHPRRSCEAMWRRLMLAEFVTDNPIPDTSDWNELWGWFGELGTREPAP